MKYSIEEIKTLLEGITPGAWAAEEVQYQWKTSNALGKHILCIYTEPDAKFIAAAPTIIRDLLAENERLSAKLGFYDNKCPVCNSTLGLLHADACPLCAARKEVERLQKHIEADAELYAALEESHREVNEQLRIEGQRAARHLADQELLVARERKRVARECIDYVNNHANDCGCSKRIAHDIRTRYGVEG